VKGGRGSLRHGFFRRKGGGCPKISPPRSFLKVGAYDDSNLSLAKIKGLQEILANANVKRATAVTI